MPLESLNKQEADAGLQSKAEPLNLSIAGKILVGIILALFAVLLLASLETTDIWSVHEGRVVSVARNMLSDGQWWVPEINGVVRLQKAPLVYWIVAGSGAIFGQVSEFSARLPSVLAGAACLLITFLIGRTLLNSPTAWLACLVQASTFAFWRDCRTAELDLYITLFVSLGMLAFIKLHFAGRRTIGWVICFWLAFAFGALVKNVLAMLPALIGCGLGLWLCRENDPRQQGTANSRKLWPWHIIGAAVFLLISLTWWASLALLFPVKGPGLWQQEIQDVLLQAKTSRPIYHYATRIFTWSFPWSVFIPASLALPFVSAGRADRKRLIWLFIWIVVIILAYSIWPAGKKKIEYIQPALPAFALLTGYVLAGLRTKQVPDAINRSGRVLVSAHALLLLLTGIAALGFSLLDEQGRSIVGLLGCGLVLVGLHGLILKGRRVDVLVWGTALGSLAGAAVMIVWFLPGLNQQVSPRIFAEKIAEQGGGVGRVVFFSASKKTPTKPIFKGQGMPALGFYLPYSVDYVNGQETLRQLLRHPQTMLVITSARSLAEFDAEGLKLTEVHRQNINTPAIILTARRLPIPGEWKDALERRLNPPAKPHRITVLLKSRQQGE